MGGVRLPVTHSSLCSTDELLVYIERDCAAWNFLQTDKKDSISSLLKLNFEWPSVIPLPDHQLHH